MAPSAPVVGLRAVTVGSAAGATVTVALALCVGSKAEVAVTVAVPVVARAAYRAVFKPVGVIVPTPLTLQVTAWLVLPETDAVKVNVSFV